MPANNLFKVEILGNEYTLKGDLDAQIVEEVADLLKLRIKEVQSSMPTANKIHILILAALNIAYEYVTSKQELEELQNLIERKGKQWISQLNSQTQEMSTSNTEAKI